MAAGRPSRAGTGRRRPRGRALPSRCDAVSRPRHHCCPTSGRGKCPPLRVHRGPRQRHVVLPADQAPDNPERGAQHTQPRAVTHSPYEPLTPGRHELAVFLHQLPIRIQVQQRVVERAALDLMDPHRCVHPRFRRRLAQTGHHRAGHFDGVGVELAHVAPVRPTGGAPDPAGVGRNEPFGEGDQLRAAGRCLLHQCARLVGRGLPIEEDGRRLTAATRTIASPFRIPVPTLVPRRGHGTDPDVPCSRRLGAA